MKLRKIGTEISENTKIDGFVKSGGTLKINGILRGGVRNAETVVIGSKGKVEGDIYSRGVTLCGKVMGDIFSISLLELLQGSTLIGDVETGRK